MDDITSESDIHDLHFQYHRDRTEEEITHDNHSLSSVPLRDFSTTGSVLKQDIKYECSLCYM